jgi:hypothetical protein
VSIDPRNHNWEKGLEKGLPDCRVKAIERETGRVRFGAHLMDKVFCANCGEPGGLTFPWCPHIFYLCDSCFAKGGTPPGTVKID